ncbi:H+/nucleoside cotransporter [Dentipellis sp. KUC8613]|nr:H+/nucleoside cotransporter [Dentipellis sp. KUC8613]
MSSALPTLESLPTAQDVGTSDAGLEKKRSRSTASFPEDKEKADHTVQEQTTSAPAEKEESDSWHARHHAKINNVLLLGTAALILGWWISSTVLPATRHRWVVQTFWAWFFLLVIAFRFVPNRVVSHPVAAIWMPLVQKPFFSLPYYVRLTMGWLALLAIVFGSAFGFKPTNGTNYGDRAISVLGLLVFQFGFWVSSRNRSRIEWRTVIVGLFFQQVIALFVLKTDAGFSIFKWIATLASDFLEQGYVGAAFFFDQDTINKHWFFVNTLSVIIFFIAFVQMMYYLGVMQWIIRNFAWFFFKTMNVSGAEAVVAAASPFIGQGESACLVKPFVDYMTDSELHLTMTSGFSTIAGSVLTAYIALGVPAQNLITASVMSIPASIAISKMRLPETDEPVTRGRVVIDRGEEKNPPANALHAFSQGAVFGVIVAGQILCNVLTILSLVATINGLLTWIGRGFGFHHLTLQLILRYVFYPVAFFLGVPRPEILRVSELLSTKLIENEFAAYLSLQALQATPEALSPRGFTIASYALCGFANLGSLGIQIGVLGALAPSRAKSIAKLGVSAMICGFISTMQAAGIA